VGQSIKKSYSLPTKYKATREEKVAFQNTDRGLIHVSTYGRHFSGALGVGGGDLAVRGGTASDKLLHILLAGTSKVVGGTLVVGNVETDFLLEGINTE